MKERLLVLGAFLAFLVPAAVGWAEYWTLARPQPRAMTDILWFLRDSVDAGDPQALAGACAKLDELAPLLEQAANGPDRAEVRASYRQGAELVKDTQNECRKPAPPAGSYLGVDLRARYKRIAMGLALLSRPHWDSGRFAWFRMSLFLVVPLELVVALVVLRWRRRERLLLASARARAAPAR